MVVYAGVVCLLLFLEVSTAKHSNASRNGDQTERGAANDAYHSTNANATIISCYYSYGDAIDPTLCTHLMVFGATIYTNGTVSFMNLSACQEIIQLKQINPNLVVSITAGGDPSQILKDPKKTKKLANQILEFLRKSKFDGFDLDWEIGGLWPIKPAYEGMAQLFKVLRENFRHESRRLYLTAAVLAVPLDIIHESYDVPALNKYLDFINLMTYDLFQYVSTQPYTGHNAPLFKRPYEFWVFGHMNTAWAAKNWHKKGMDYKKIAVGIPTYARTYKLVFTFWHSVWAPAKGCGQMGCSTSYQQVCHLLHEEKYSRVWDEYAKVPYCYKDEQWISYDDEESVAGKAEWIKREGFGGAMIFDFSHDDPKGECDGQTKFPLHRKIWSILKG